VSEPTAPAIFLDRDGVLNEDIPGAFVTCLGELRVIPGAPEAVARLNAAGYVTVVVTNQSGVARGLYTEQVLRSIHDSIGATVTASGGAIAAFYYCPHVPEAGCDCRKPNTGMVARAIADLGLDPCRSWFVGDKPSDIECGHTAGCRTAFVLSGLSPSYDPTAFSVQPDRVFADLAEAATEIIAAGCEEYLGCRDARPHRLKYQAALAKVADVEPPEDDRL
jgi:D-glycero-D-manno-heptose 1,7-bisphosphate phosphatase